MSSEVGPVSAPKVRAVRWMVKGVWIVRRRRRIYTRAEVCSSWQDQWGRRHQVVGGSEWVRKCRVGGIRDVCQGAVGLLCVVWLSLLLMFLLSSFFIPQQPPVAHGRLNIEAS